jgi:hypothetical protein
MYDLGLPAPGCIFVMTEDSLEIKLEEYFSRYNNNDQLYTVRTDTINTSMSCKRILSATPDQTINCASEWFAEGFQIILQEFIDERKEVKSGNIWLKNNVIIIEGAINKHIHFTNGLKGANGSSLDVNLVTPRFDSFEISIHKFFVEQKCFSYSDILRLIRLARKIPYTNAVVEFSFFNDGRLYFWEIKKERS